MDGPCWGSVADGGPEGDEGGAGWGGWLAGARIGACEGARALGPPPAPGTRLVAAAVQAAVVVSAAGERCAGGHLSGVGIVTAGRVVARAAWPWGRGTGVGGS